MKVHFGLARVFFWVCCAGVFVDAADVFAFRKIPAAGVGVRECMLAGFGFAVGAVANYLVLRHRPQSSR